MNGTAERIHDIAILVACAATLLAIARVYFWPVVRFYVRRRALRRELDAARKGHTHGDPGRARVSTLRPRLCAEDRRGLDVSGVLPLRLSDAGLVVEHGSRAATAGVSRGVAFRRELAARGQAVDELQIEDLIRD